MTHNNSTNMTVAEIQAQIQYWQQQLINADMPLDEAYDKLKGLHAMDPNSFDWRTSRIAALRVILRHVEALTKGEGQ
jgi:hypothetical protein